MAMGKCWGFSDLRTKNESILLVLPFNLLETDTGYTEFYFAHGGSCRIIVSIIVSRWIWQIEL